MLVVCLSDLMFQSRILEAAAALGIRTRVVDSADMMDAVQHSDADAAVVDMNERAFDSLEAIKQLSQRHVRVLAFGRHTEPASLRAARDAGAAIVITRAQLAEDLPRILGELAAQETPSPNI
jgi:DNA-binding NarL/FixJ family response regulator